MMPDSSKSWTRRIRKFLTSSGADKRLLFRCLWVVLATRLGLSLFSYKTVRGWIPDGARNEVATPETLQRIRWAVRGAARVVPRASCLTQALAAQFVLARLGHPSQIQVGVAKDPSGRLLAHAWLISDGRVVIGGSARELARYSLLPGVDASPS
jgi:hypothetical protein